MMNYKIMLTIKRILKNWKVFVLPIILIIVGIQQIIEIGFEDEFSIAIWIIIISTSIIIIIASIGKILGLEDKNGKNG